MPAINDFRLTDVVTLKNWLGLKADDVNSDVVLDRLILAGTEVFKRLVSRPIFISTSLEEVHRGNDSYRIILNTQPVTSIVSVSSFGSNINVYSPNPFQVGYSFDKYGLTGVGIRFSSWTEYTIQYVGGFELTSPEAYAAEQAVISLCGLWWRRRLHTDQEVQSLGQQVTARFIQDELPPETRAIVQSLKRVA